MRAVIDQKLRDDLLASRREERGEPGNQIEQVGADANPAGGETHRQEECRKEGQEKIEGDRLRNRAAAGKDPAEHPESALGESCGGKHGCALYPALGLLS